MAILIILVYGESRHLVPKPADYEALIVIARAKFPELNGVANDNIAFHFTPEWFDSEVEMDRDAFSEVHARAVLRITTTVPAPAQHPGNDLEANKQDAGVPAQGPGSSPSTQASGSPEVSSIDWIPITVHYVWDGDEFQTEVDPEDTLWSILDESASYFNVHVDDIWLCYKQREAFGSDTPQGLGMKPGDTIEVTYDDSRSDTEPLNLSP